MLAKVLTFQDFTEFLREGIFLHVHFKKAVPAGLAVAGALKERRLCSWFQRVFAGFVGLVRYVTCLLYK